MGLLVRVSDGPFGPRQNKKQDPHIRYTGSDLSLRMRHMDRSTLNFYIYFSNYTLYRYSNNKRKQHLQHMAMSMSDTLSPSIGDIVARVFLSAALISCAIPTIFFLIVTESELRIVKDTFKRYIDNRCAFLRPWVAGTLSSEQVINFSSIAMSKNTSESDKIESTNVQLRYLAFQSSLLIMVGLMGIAMTIWFLFGRQSTFELMTRTFFYVFIFCVTEIAFIVVMSYLPFYEIRNIDVVILNRLIALGKDC